MPPLSYSSQESARTRERTRSSPLFGAVMKDHSQKDYVNRYSPLMCILLLLTVGAATQLKVQSHWF
jgi:hypothetical protein